MRAIRITAAIGLCAGMVACGDTTTEQVLYGGGAGMVTSALLDGNLVAGAAVGAAANVIYCQENPSKC
jgi:osmotically inducible lipoprotein OsmB